MLIINTTPTDALNCSRVNIHLDSAAMYSMTYRLDCHSARTVTDADGNKSTLNGLIHSELMKVDGAAWTAWGKTPGETDSGYIGNLCLSQLGLERDDTVVAVEPVAE